jgi:hypothetical protein
MKIVDVELHMGSRKKFEPETPNDDKYFLFTPGVKVLPAQHINDEHGTVFTFVRKHDIGTKGWIDGGYECRDNSGSFRAFHLDALIIHPSVFKEKWGGSVDKPATIVQKIIKVTSGRKGRPSLSDEEKDKRTQDKIERTILSGGKRGRPKSTNEPKQMKLTSGKKGRPKLSDDARAIKMAHINAIQLKSNGKKGRPRKLVKN